MAKGAGRAQGPEVLGALGPAGPGLGRPWAPGLGQLPVAMSHERGTLSNEPWTIINGLNNKLMNN